MKGEYSPARPLVMHVDLNSCFATVEQQARPRLRGKPIAIVNRRTEHTAIVTASYEAKAMGVKVGMKLRDAQKLCPGIIGVESDPAKYRYVYHKLMNIMRDYSPNFTMKSIDEGVIDFNQTSAIIRSRDMEDIGREIKQRLKDEIGCAMRCNVGIGTNRFLAKTAAGLHKPDGMDVLTSHNIRQVFSMLKLTNITGIADRNEHRLNAVGIYTPLQFLDADAELLAKVVFKSVCGYQWHQRLRGWEVDDVSYDLKTCGRQYVLEQRDLPRADVLARLHTLAEATGAKLRSQNKCARGVGVYARLQGVRGLGESNGRWGRKGEPGLRGAYASSNHSSPRPERFSLVDVGGSTPSYDKSSMASPLSSFEQGEDPRRTGYWHQKYLAPLPFFSDTAIWAIASRLFASVPAGSVREIGIHVYHLQDGLGDQLSLFGDELAREQQITQAIDEINQRYGERTICSADTVQSNTIVKTKIPFGSTRYL